MMERCPNCQARQPGESLCRRCGMDLALLNQIRRQAETLVGEAIAHLEIGHLSLALSALKGAGRLYSDPMIHYLLGFILQEETPPLQPGRQSFADTP